MRNAAVPMPSGLLRSFGSSTSPVMVSSVGKPGDDSSVEASPDCADDEAASAVPCDVSTGVTVSVSPMASPLSIRNFLATATSPALLGMRPLCR